MEAEAEAAAEDASQSNERDMFGRTAVVGAAAFKPSPHTMHPILSGLYAYFNCTKAFLSLESSTRAIEVLWYQSHLAHTQASPALKLPPAPSRASGHAQRKATHA